MQLPQYALDRKPSQGWLTLTRRRSSLYYQKNRSWVRWVVLVLSGIFVLFRLVVNSEPSIESRRKGVPFLNLWPDPSLDPRTLDPVETKIPHIVHYIYGLKAEDATFPSHSILKFYHYLAAKSALQVIQPHDIYWHYIYPPRGWWWEQLETEMASSNTRLHLVQAREIDMIFDRAVEHYAHKADILRLEILHTYGGIYLDLDLLILRNISSDELHLRDQDVVMALEAASGDPERFPPDPKSVTSGLCNAFIMSKPFAAFISRWYESYRDFDGQEWALHSVARPWEIAKLHPDEVTVLGRGAVFWPLYNSEGLAAVHSNRKYDFSVTRQLGYHMWETQAMKLADGLASVDPVRVWEQKQQTSFTRMARRFITADLVERWKVARAAGDVD